MMEPTDFLVRVSFDHERLKNQSNAKRPLVLPICLQLDSLQFPHPEWSDFAVVILGWWLEGALSLQTHKSVETAFRFMDGPYELLVTVVQDDHWAAMPISRGLGGQQENTYVLRGSQVISELGRVSFDLLRMCRVIGKWDKDCETLESMVKTLSND